MSYVSGFKSKRHLQDLFGCELEDDTDILIAILGDNGPEKYAFVLFRFEGNILEVNAIAHPDTGFDDMWDAETVDTSELLNRLMHQGIGLFDKVYAGMPKKKAAGLRAAVKCLVN